MITEKLLKERELQYRAIQRDILVRRFDADETAFLERELNQLRQKLYEVQFPASVARTFAPKAGDIAASAETYSYKVYKPVGEAKFVAYQGEDIPRIDVVAFEVFGKVRPIGASYAWNINELREAARTGVPLSEVKARMARSAVERSIDSVLANGGLTEPGGTTPDVGMLGLTNNSFVEGSALANVDAGIFWFSATPPDPEDVLADLTKVVAAVSNNSKNVFAADALLLPLAHYNYAQQTPFSALSGISILTVFKMNNPQITTIAPWHKLDTAGTGADSGKPRAIAYQKTPDVLEMVIPQEFETMPPDMDGFEMVINCHARCGGTKVYQPLGMRYIDFPTS
jgi:hypothetical protein